MKQLMCYNGREAFGDCTEREAAEIKSEMEKIAADLGIEIEWTNNPFNYNENCDDIFMQALNNVGKAEKYAHVHGSGVFDMTWDDVMDLIRENPVCSKGIEDEEAVVGSDGISYSCRQLAALAGVELEIED